MTRLVLPTTDLYFLGSCHEWIRHWWRDGPIERIGANSFRSKNSFLLIRRDKPRLMERAISWLGPLVYLIDDDIAGAAESRNLPIPYKARLAEFSDSYYDRLLRRADIIVTSSNVLAAKLRADSRVRAEIAHLDPFWNLPFADQSHFPASLDGMLDLVHLGTASHASGLVAITPAVIATLDRFPNTRFTFVGPIGSHPRLEAHVRVRRLDVMRWRRYRHWLPRQRFHLALYPLDRTPFDQARSANKVFEHAVVGAVGIYPRDWCFSKMVGRGAFLAPPDPAEWTEALFEAVERRSELIGMGETAATMLSDFHADAAQRHMWSKLLNLAASGPFDR
jgi:hypothetical protein